LAGASDDRTKLGLLEEIADAQRKLADLDQEAVATAIKERNSRQNTQDTLKILTLGIKGQDVDPGGKRDQFEKDLAARLSDRADAAERELEAFRKTVSLKPAPGTILDPTISGGEAGPAPGTILAPTIGGGAAGAAGAKGAAAAGGGMKVSMVGLEEQFSRLGTGDAGTQQQLAEDQKRIATEQLDEQRRIRTALERGGGSVQWLGVSP